MATKYVLKFSAIIEFLENENKTIKKGENAVESGHVKHMLYDAGLCMIRGEIYASMKDKIYNVEIALDQEGDITSATCSCPRGIKCHHIAALALFGHYNISVTDSECSWNRPKCKTDEVYTSEELYPAKPFSAVNRAFTENELNSLQEKLANLGSTVGFSWLLQKESTEVNMKSVVPLIDDIIHSKEFYRVINKATYLKEKCHINDTIIQDVAKCTVGQSQNENWLMVQKYRLTASNCGAVLQACSRNKFPPSLFKMLNGVYKLDGVKAIQWGRLHERAGIRHVEETLNLKVHPTGIWLSNSGFLGGSPDGLIGDDSIIEVKCPYSYRNNLLSETLKQNNKCIIYFNEEGNIVIVENHHYYHQIQGLLHIMKKSKCYLCIWTTKEAVIVTIEKDISWAGNLPVLEKFYLNEYLKTLISNKI